MIDPKSFRFQVALGTPIWLGSGAWPPLLVIQAGRDRENVLISVSPMPNIREYLHTDWGPLRSQIYE